MTDTGSKFAKANNIHEIISTGNGHRGVVFHFDLWDGSRKSVTYDFYGAGSRFDGSEYIRLESAAIASMIVAGFTAEHVKRFTHHLILR